MPVEPGQAAGKSSTNLILIILVVVLLLGNGATLYFLLKKPAKVSENNTNALITNENINQENATTTTSGENEIMVNWLAAPVKINTANIIDISTVRDYIDKNQDLKNIYQTAENYLTSFDVSQTGIVDKGKYANQPIYLVNAYGMDFNGSWIVIKNNDDLSLLSKHSSPTTGLPSKLFVPDSDSQIMNLETPDTIQLSDGTILSKIDNKNSMQFFNNYPSKVVAKYDGDKDLFLTNNGCLVLPAQDGTLRSYQLKVDFLGVMGSSDLSHMLPYKLDFTFNDGKSNTREYVINNYELGCYNYANYINSVDQLVKIGTTKSGQNIYELKDVDTQSTGEYGDKYSILRTMYDNYYPGFDEKTQKELPKIAWQKFLTDKPLIFWQTPFGKFIVFQNSKYAPIAEMGKPVVYLYPTKTTDVTVKVNPTGGFTKTEPAYGNGWQVKAEPNGNLYNYQDKKNYPYLFWEGYSLNYAMSNEGFVVAKNDVNKFLREKLAIQGLNEKEINDFMEFWLPRMQSDPYYFVTFVPQAEFDKMAPLTVSPRPDTVIRVFMDFKALEKPISVKEQKLTTPKRSGFTVVEWGGEMQK